MRPGRPTAPLPPNRHEIGPPESKLANSGNSALRDDRPLPDTLMYPSTRRFNVGNFKKCAAVLALLFLSGGVCAVASAQEVAPGQTEAVGFIGGVTDGG